jgi:hypothetical protein
MHHVHHGLSYRRPFLLPARSPVTRVRTIPLARQSSNRKRETPTPLIRELVAIGTQFHHLYWLGDNDYRLFTVDGILNAFSTSPSPSPKEDVDFLKSVMRVCTGRRCMASPPKSPKPSPKSPKLKRYSSVGFVGFRRLEPTPGRNSYGGTRTKRTFVGTVVSAFHIVS